MKAEWTAIPSAATDADEKPESVGDPTPDIEYDMVAYISTDDSNVKCRAWYANDCGEIHFMPRSAIMNQHHLNYNRAWVDLKIEPQRWYTLSMPLKQVFAGDFYLPKDNACQESELFLPITYSTDLNNRFNPAVFQRGWDKGSAETYLSDGTTSTAVVKANWSHVYNDVEEAYGSGTGFAIKADVSRFETAPEAVIFRLPKDDKSYDYYDADGTLLNADNNKVVRNEENAADHYRLNDGDGYIEAVTAGKEYFLVGNPFMTHLDIKEFLKENENLIYPKYWLVTSDTQKSAVFDEDSEIVLGDAPAIVAPMQGFFVQAKPAAGDEAAAEGSTNTLKLHYTTSMMVAGSFHSDAAPLKVATRAGELPREIRIEAINGGRISTTAIVVMNANASDRYVASEDVAVLDNSDLEIGATVYTVGESKALSINSLEKINNVELGVIALPEEETVLRFSCDEGYDPEDGVMLYDAATGETIPVTDGMEYTVNGKISGRLFLTAGIEEVDANGINISVNGDEVTVTAAVADTEMKVAVYDYSGRLINNLTTDDQEVKFTLSKGAYIIEAVSGSDRKCQRIII